ncbi:MAG: Gfo/Idh/MocA family oxidoreductase [Pirellula sp.]
MFRRTVLKATGISAAAIAIAPFHYRRVLGANSRIGIGFIGYGLIGSRHVADFKREPDVDLVAMSDVHSQRQQQGLAAFGHADAKGYSDFRKLLEDNRVHGVVISTPDHWHALQAMLACDAGKDVYVEKPLTLFQREGQWLIRVSKRTKRIVQVGTQQRSGLHYQRAKAFLQSDGIGRIHSVRATSHRNISPGFGTAADGEPPKELDWDMWLGPAPTRPYNPLRGIYHFRWYWDHAGGQMTNLGAHHLDIVDWICGLGSLQSVTSIGGRLVLKDQSETPDTQETVFDLGQFTIGYSIRETSGGNSFTRFSETGAESSATPSSLGLEFAGNKGQLSINRSRYRVVGDSANQPESQIPGIGTHPAGGPSAPVSKSQRKQRIDSVEDNTGSDIEQFQNHVRNFLDCMASRTPPISDVESAHRTATACHLANISLRLGKQVRWDPVAEKVLNDTQAQGMLTREYRSPWDRELRSVVDR